MGGKAQPSLDEQLQPNSGLNDSKDGVGSSPTSSVLVGSRSAARNSVNLAPYTLSSISSSNTAANLATVGFKNSNAKVVQARTSLLAHAPILGTSTHATSAQIQIGSSQQVSRFTPHHRAVARAPLTTSLQRPTKRPRKDHDVVCNFHFHSVTSE